MDHIVSATWPQLSQPCGFSDTIIAARRRSNVDQPFIIADLTLLSPTTPDTSFRASLAWLWCFLARKCTMIEVLKLREPGSLFSCIQRAPGRPPTQVVRTADLAFAVVRGKAVRAVYLSIACVTPVHGNIFILRVVVAGPLITAYVLVAC